jgi:hypothetical protein
MGAAQLSGQPASPAVHVALGSHLASGTLRKDQAFDVGAGWVVDQADQLTSRGAYLDGSVFVARGPWIRTSVGGRSELRWTPNGLGIATKLRADHEIFYTRDGDFMEGGRCGAIVGTAYGVTAIGVFAEAGHVWIRGSEDAWIATAGVSVRIPSMIGMAIGIPGC